MPILASSPHETYIKLKELLETLIPDFEIRLKADLVFQINSLKAELGATILAHNYMEPALFHGVADIVGDSLQLAREAVNVNQDLLVMCGVRFMAETAKILNPSKTVLLPTVRGGCSLAESITAKDVRDLKQKYPNVPVIAYVNCYAEVKAEVDVCCTSSNAEKIVRSFDSDTIIFLPDNYLARNIALITNKEVILPDFSPPFPSSGNGNSNGAKGGTSNLKSMLLTWHGVCEVHEKFSVQDIESTRLQFPDSVVLAHPECSPEVVSAADFTGSTSAMIEFVKTSQAPKFLLLTECSMAENIIAQNPSKNILRLCSVRCPHMNEITLQDTLNALRKNQYEITLAPDIISRAKRSLDRMLELS